jgi:hypothetical protein
MHESILHTQKCEMSTSQRSVLCTPFVTFPAVTMSLCHLARDKETRSSKKHLTIHSHIPL